jgi:hypothetical protein
MPSDHSAHARWHVRDEWLPERHHFNNVHPGRYVLRIGGIDYPLEVGETQMQDIPVIAPARH